MSSTSRGCTQTPSELLTAAADTFRERSKVYKDNYKVVGKVMQALFPNGVVLLTAEDHNRFHLFMLVVVKMSRYVQNWSDGGHHDSMLDLSVYGAMVCSVDAEARKCTR